MVIVRLPKEGTAFCPRSHRVRTPKVGRFVLPNPNQGRWNDRMSLAPFRLSTTCSTYHRNSRCVSAHALPGLEPCARQSPRSRQSRRQTNRPSGMLQLSLRHTIFPQIRRNTPPLAAHRGSVPFLPCAIQASRRGEIIPRRRKYS